MIDFGSDLAASRSGARASAFVVDAVVTVGVTLVTKPKPVEELQGLVYGMANAERAEREARARLVRAADAARRRSLVGCRRPDRRLLVGDDDG